MSPLGILGIVLSLYLWILGMSRFFKKEICNKITRFLEDRMLYREI